MAARGRWEHLNDNPKVKSAVDAVGARVAARAQAITDREGGQARIRVERSHRPKGRYQNRVISDRPDEEYGSEKQKRIRQLGRAMREG